MAKRSVKEKGPSGPGRAATAEDVLRLCGTIDDAKVVEIVNLAPTIEELEEAVAWSADEGETLGKDDVLRGIETGRERARDVQEPSSVTKHLCSPTVLLQ